MAIYKDPVSLHVQLGAQWLHFQRVEIWDVELCLEVGTVSNQEVKSSLTKKLGRKDNDV